MEKKNNEELMNASTLIEITPEFKGELKTGTLIGFKGLGKEKGITAAYPVYRFLDKEIQFVLFTKQNGQHVIDNTWLTSKDLFINEPPIIIDLNVKTTPTQL